MSESELLVNISLSLPTLDRESVSKHLGPLMESGHRGGRNVDAHRRAAVRSGRGNRMNFGILAVDLSGAWIGLAMAIGFVLGQALERWRGRQLGGEGQDGKRSAPG
jgi:hypothetical protein